MYLYRNGLEKMLGIIAVFTFISIAVFGPLSIVHSHHKPGCPFVAGGHSICPMGFMEHINHWKSIFTIPVPFLLFLIIILFSIITIWQFAEPPNSLFRIKHTFEHTVLHNSLYQKLFSQGILNPKAP